MRSMWFQWTGATCLSKVSSTCRPFWRSAPIARSRLTVFHRIIAATTRLRPLAQVSQFQADLKRFAGSRICETRSRSGFAR